MQRQLSVRHKHVLEIIQKYCTFIFSRTQEKEYRSMHVWGVEGLNQDLFLTKSLHDFAICYGTDTTLHYEMGKCVSVFKVNELVNPTLYMIASNFWFYVIQPSLLFPCGAVYYRRRNRRRRRKAMEKEEEGGIVSFAVVFETGQYFSCGPSIEDQYRQLSQLISAISDMRQSSRSDTSYGLL